MYLVTLKERENSESIVIHNPFTDGAKLLSGGINTSTNDIDSFDLELDYNNPGYNKIKPMRSIVEVRNIKDNHLEFIGRVVNYTDTMTTDGIHAKNMVCEGTLGYLHDSHQPYIEYSGSPEGLFTRLIENHNSQVEENKRLNLGSISLRRRIDLNGSTINDTEGPVPEDVNCFITPEDSTFEAIKKYLIDVVGGEIHLRNNGLFWYIDYIYNVGHDSDEDIAIARNLRSITKKSDPSNIVTRLIPLGAIVSTEDPDDNEKRVTIEEINNGRNYVERSDLVAEFGIQTGVYIWDEIVGRNALRNRAVSRLNEQKIVLQQFTLDAIDLFKLGKGIEQFKVGNTHLVINPIMSLNERIRIVKSKVDVVDPINSTLTIGDKFKTLVEYQKEQRDASRNYNKLQSLVSQQRGSINAISNRISEVQTTLINTNIAQLPADLLAINLQLMDIQDSIEAIPTIGPVTQLKDGLMTFQDKVKLDSMTPHVPLRKFSSNIGDGISNSHLLTHSLQSQDVIVSVRETVSPFNRVMVDIEFTSINTVTIRTESPIPSNQPLRVTIIG